MLIDVINFVKSRSDLADRDAILREINYAWNEIWNSDDLPNSMFEVSVISPEATASRIALPYFVGKIRAVKDSSRARIELNTMRPWYHNSEYAQSPYTWRILGTSPLATTITNATRLQFSIPEAEESEFSVTVIGPDDHATTARDTLTFPIGTTSVWTTKQFTDVKSLYKDKYITQNLTIAGANGEDFGFIPNLANTVNHQIIQIADKCSSCCASCRCFDVLYKLPAPVLFYDEQEVEYQEVVMTKALEWIQMPKLDGADSVNMFAEKSKALLVGFNTNNVPGISHKMDLAPNLFASWTGSGDRKL